MATYTIPRTLQCLVATGDLSRFSYLGMVRMSGERVSPDGPEFVFYGKYISEFDGREKTVWWSSNSPQEFGNLNGPFAVLLQDDSGAHNLWIQPDSATHDALVDSLGIVADCIAFAVGGQYYHAERPVWREGCYDGVYLYMIIATGGGLKAERCQMLVNGLHPGCTESRVKCGGCGEFDGQSTLVKCEEHYLLFTRANCSVHGGYRRVQVAVASVNHFPIHFGAFSLIDFPLLPDDADIYFAHPLVVDGQLLLIMPIAFVPPNEKASGIFVSRMAWQMDGKPFFLAPWRLFSSEAVRGRTVDVSVAATCFDEYKQQLVVLIQRDVRTRMTKEMHRVDRTERLEWWSFDIKSVLRENVNHISPGDRGWLADYIPSPPPMRSASFSSYSSEFSSLSEEGASAGPSVVAPVRDAPTLDQSYAHCPTCWQEWKLPEPHKGTCTRCKRVVHFGRLTDARSQHRCRQGQARASKSEALRPDPSSSCTWDFAEATQDVNFKRGCRLLRLYNEGQRKRKMNDRNWTQEDRYNAVVYGDCIPMEQMARHYRSCALQDLQREPSYVLTYVEMLAVFDKWRSDWTTYMGVHALISRSKFQSYLHKGSDPWGHHLLEMLVLTGWSVQFLKREVENTWPREKQRTLMAGQKVWTRAKVAKKARRISAWVDNKALTFAQEHVLCERCGDHNDWRPLNDCFQCERNVCSSCMPEHQVSCRYCPDYHTCGDDVHHGWRCRKCHWECRTWRGERLLSCVNCSLAICPFCRALDAEPRCERDCPAFPRFHTQSRSQIVHPNAQNIFQRWKSGRDRGNAARQTALARSPVKINQRLGLIGAILFV